MIRFEHFVFALVLLLLVAAEASAKPPARQQVHLSPAERHALADLEYMDSLAESKIAAGQFEEAIVLLRKIQVRREKLFGKDHWRTRNTAIAIADTQFVLAMSAAERESWDQSSNRLPKTRKLLIEQGQLVEATEVQRKINEQVGDLFGRRHRLYGMCLTDLGNLLSLRKCWGDAEESLLGAIDILEASVGQVHPDYLACLYSLADVSNHLGNHAQASERFDLYIRLHSKTFEWDDEVYRVVYYRAACVALEAKLLDRAETLCREMTRGLAPELPARSDDYLDALLLLELVLRVKGEYGKVAAVHQEISAELERRGGWSIDPKYVEFARSVGSYYSELEEYERASEFYDAALQANPNYRSFNRENWRRLMILRALNALDRNDPGDAERCLNEISSDVEQQGATHSLDSLGISLCWARLHRKRGDLKSCEKSLAMAKTMMKEGHVNELDKARLLMEQAMLCVASPDFKTAERLLRQVAEIYAAYYGQSRLVLAECDEDLAQVLAELGDIESAERHYRSALEIRQRAVGQDHAAYANGLLELARFQARFASQDESASLVSRAVSIYEASYADRPAVLAARLRVCAAVLDELGDKGATAKLRARAKTLVDESLEPSSELPE